MQPPLTRYAERDGVSIAYQVSGEGPVDLLFAPGFVSHLDLQWTDAGFARFLTRLSSFSRLIRYDKPGTGLSDPIPHLPTLEERAADMIAVLDAAGSEHATVVGFSESGPTAVLLAATRPDRVRSLVLYGTFPAAFETLDAEDLATIPPEVQEALREVRAALDTAVSRWGEGAAMDLFAPSLTSEVQRRFFGTFERAAASPRMARALVDSVRSIDVRDLLPAVHCPTLVLHHRGDRVIPLIAGATLAEHIPGARFVAVDGDDHAFWYGDFDPVVDEIERFLTGAVRHAEPDRVLATVLFTDIVGSTELAAELGDAKWREVLERHDALVSEVVTGHGGRVVKHIGDGALSTFGGPARAVRCADELCRRAPDLGIALRAGVHTGECEAIGDDLGGLAVHIGARVSAQASAGEVVVSGTVKDLVVGSGMQFADRGEHRLKGVPGDWRLFVLGEGRPQARAAPLDAAADHMRVGDRIAVSLARRAPRAMRLATRLAPR